jgi:thiamine kinase-like enzyme
MRPQETNGSDFADQKNSSTDIALANQIFARFQGLHALSSEKLPTGEEAHSITRYLSSFSIVMKVIAPQTAKEEVQQLTRLNAAVPGISPQILYSDFDQGLYITTYAEGDTLEKKIADAEFSFDAEKLKSLISPSACLLRNLHEVTARPYDCEYHKVIVEKRIAEILQHPETLKNLRSHTNASVETFYRDFSPANETISTPTSLQDDLEGLAEIYKDNPPKIEALIHGDPHFGNIIVNGDKVTLIDPRITWDRCENKKSGYFDPLYDVACLAHSLLANMILARSDILFSDAKKREVLCRIAYEALPLYLQRPPTDGECANYLTYLACCMSGNLKYPRLTPSAKAFWLTLHFIKSAARSPSTVY